MRKRVMMYTEINYRIRKNTLNPDKGKTGESQ